MCHADCQSATRQVANLRYGAGVRMGLNGLTGMT